MRGENQEQAQWYSFEGPFFADDTGGSRRRSRLGAGRRGATTGWFVPPGDPEPGQQERQADERHEPGAEPESGREAAIFGYHSGGDLEEYAQLVLSHRCYHILWPATA